MSKSSREKGKRGEREAAAYLEELGLATRPRRGVQYQGGPESPDVVDEDGDIHWEVKRTERLRLYEAVDQAVMDSAESCKCPVVLHKANRKDWLLIVRLSDVRMLVSAMFPRLVNRG